MRQEGYCQHIKKICGIEFTCCFTCHDLNDFKEIEIDGVFAGKGCCAAQKAMGKMKADKVIHDEYADIDEGEEDWKMLVKAGALILAFFFIPPTATFFLGKNIGIKEGIKIGYADAYQQMKNETTTKFPDGCMVKLINNTDWRVTNPETCPDKNFVQYLNCYDQGLLPKEQRPKECQ